MGCGTGLVGECIKKEGRFTKIAGVDASQGMVDTAGKKNAYSELK
jgi:predicted TPR repeat methyltransferase